MRDAVYTRMEAQALDLSRLRHREPWQEQAIERADVSRDQIRWHAANPTEVPDATFDGLYGKIHDPKIAEAIRRVQAAERATGGKITAGVGGIVVCLNYRPNEGGPGTSTASFTTLQAITPTQFTDQVPAGGAMQGTIFKINGFGIYGTAATAPTGQLGVGLSGAAPTTWATAATTLQASQTIAVWQMIFLAIVTLGGATGTIQGSGNVNGWGSTATAGANLPATQVTALTWNTTVNNYFNLGAAFGTSSASNAITVNGLAIEQYN